MDELRQRFLAVRPDYKIWMEQVLAVLRLDPVIANMRPVGISGRVKTPESLVEKVARKHDPDCRPITAGNFTDEFTDLAGVRLVLPSKTAIERACERIGELDRLGYWRVDHVVATIWHPADREFFEREIETYHYPHEQLLYVGRHFVVEPKDNRNSEARHIACEIQVRTALEESVLAVGHQLAYKRDVPGHIVDQLNGAIESMQVLDEAIRKIERAATNLGQAA